MLTAQRLAVTLSTVLLLQGFAAFAADPQWLVTVDKRGKSFVVDATIDFPAPLRTAWDVLTDFDHMTAILNNLSTSKIVSRTDNTLQVQQEGVARYGIFSYTFTSEREIRLEPMQRIVARQLSGNAKSFVSELQLSPSDDGTEVRYHAEVVPSSGIARTFGGPFIKHETEEQFRAMGAEMARRQAP
ncbi:MAG: hypothetical protein H6R17_3172 [Proteobacteria bacterium]|nr:hypothetical protein [Pseudomonadota bacterium]